MEIVFVNTVVQGATCVWSCIELLVSHASIARENFHSVTMNFE